MSEISYSINAGVLIVKDKVITLPYPVAQAIDCHGILIVRVEPSIGDIYNKNVFAYSNDGELMWQIQESPHGTEIDKPYTSIVLSNESKLIAGNWNGVDYLVELKSGRITTSSFKK